MYDILFSKKFIVSSLLIAAWYVITVTYLMNLNLVRDTLIGQYPFDYKLKLLVTLLEGIWTAMGTLPLTILFLTAILTGANLTLFVQRILFLGRTGNGHLMVGGSTILGFVSSGCASCGLPILSILGLSGAILYLPLRGLELSYIAIFLLLISFYSQLKNDFRTCEIRKN